MNKNTRKKQLPYIIFIVIYFLFFGALLAVGSVYDLEIEKNLFNPQNSFAKFFEIWGEVPRFAMWAPAATVLLFTRHNLADCLEIIHKILPFIPCLSEEAKTKKPYIVLNKIVNIVEIIGFTVLAILGWDKVIRNVGKYYVDLSKGIWYLISAVVALIVFAIFTKIPKRILNKLEPLALAGILMGILFMFEAPIKSIANRARFREIVAYSAGIEDPKSIAINSSLIDRANFDYYTNWYQKGFGGEVINSFELEGTSCPSGHVISGCFIFLSAVFCNTFKKLKKLTIPACIVSFVYVGTLGFTRILRGAHFLSDIALGAMVGMIFFLITVGILKLFYRKSILPTRDI